MARARWQLEVPAPVRPDGPLALRDAQGRPLLRWQTLGAASVAVGSERIDPSAGTIFALLLRLTYAPAMTVARDTLLRGIWPGQVEHRQRANMRQALYKLRRMGIQTGLDGDRVTLDPAQCLPVFAIERTATRFEEDVTRGHEPFGLFLPGYETGWPEFDEWLTGVRDSVHADVRRVLVEQLRSRRERADWMGAHALAKWLLQFDPLNEDATLTHAECTLLNGSKAEAVAILDRYLAELGLDAGDIRLPATLLRRRIADAGGKQRVSFAPSERHFVGREQLMAELTLAMRRAKWHDGSATLLHGPPGMGKTRVTQELAKVAAIEGFRVVSVSCRESDQERPLSVFLSLVPELLEMPGAMGCDPESMDVLRRFVGNLPVDATGATGPGAASGLRHPPAGQSIARLRAAVADLMRALSFEAPLMLILDDVHWIDEKSTRVLGDVFRMARLNRFYLFACSRSPSAAWLASISGNPMQLIEIKALPSESCDLLANALYSEYAVHASPSTHAWITKACEGNPLFLHSLIGHWIESGQAGGVPPSLARLIERRLDALSSTALYAMQAVALFGRYATIGAIARVLELPTTILLTALEELANAGILRSGEDERVQIHELVVLAACRRLSEHAGRLLHLRIADYLRTGALQSDKSVAVDVAAHLRLARSSRDLQAFTTETVRRYLDTGSAFLALAVCDETIRDSRDSGLKDAIMPLHVEAAFQAGHHARLLEEFEPGWAVGRDASWDEEHAELVLRIIEAARYSDVWDDYVELSARAVLLAQSPRVPWLTRFQAACLALRTSVNAPCAEHAARAHAAGRAVIPYLTDPEGAREELEMFFHTGFGESQRALAAARTLASRTPAHHSSPADIAFVRGCVGYALRVNGAPEESRLLYLQTFEEALRAETYSVAAHSAWGLSLVHMDLDDGLQEAEAWIDRGLSIARLLSSDRLTIILLENAARVAIMKQDREKLADVLSQLDVISKPSSVPFRAAFATALRLGRSILDKNVTEVERFLAIGMRNYESVKAFIGQDFFVTQLVQALLFLGRPHDGQLLLETYLRSDRRVGQQISACLRGLQSPAYESASESVSLSEA